jgi:hypothetical protein
MSTKQTKTTTNSTDDKCDKCSEWREQGYMQCPKCLKRLRFDPAEFITETILALPSHKRDYDATTKLDYINFNHNGYFQQLAEKVKEKFPNERFILNCIRGTDNNTVKLPLSDNKIIILYTQTQLLNIEYPAIGCINDVVREGTSHVMFLVWSEIKNSLLHNNCLFTGNWASMTNIKAIFNYDYVSVIDLIVAVDKMSANQLAKFKKILFP